MCFNIYSKKLNTRQFVTQKLVTFSILHFTISKINFDEKKNRLKVLAMTISLPGNTSHI
jgi:stalled ribosome rescue protein Dom34